MNVVGRKSKLAFIWAFLGSGIAVATGAAFMFMVIWFNVPELFGYMGYLMCIVPVMMVGLGILSFVNGYKIKKLPNDLISMDETNIYFAYPKQTIKIADIEAITGANSSSTYKKGKKGRFVSFENYGAVVIRAKDQQRYVQKHVDKVQEVAEILKSKIGKK
ncbi:MAG: hypothetical protein LBG88_03980 [Christensenellaceae bacterium]|jgi:hypothetical protein|nr:hypothetical protein [Christensenellaceae bacterium]